jgi:hypothetical protein
MMFCLDAPVIERLKIFAVFSHLSGFRFLLSLSRRGCLGRRDIFAIRDDRLQHW